MSEYVRVCQSNFLKVITLIGSLLFFTSSASAMEMPKTPFDTSKIQVRCQQVQVFEDNTTDKKPLTKPVPNAEYTELLKQVCLLPLYYPKAFKAQPDQAVGQQYVRALEQLQAKIIQLYTQRNNHRMYAIFIHNYDVDPDNGSLTPRISGWLAMYNDVQDEIQKDTQRYAHETAQELYNIILTWSNNQF